MFQARRLTTKFCEYYDSFDTFKAKYDELPSSLKVVDYSQLEIIYWLLMGQYANSDFANLSIGMANQRVFNTIYQYAPIYFKKRSITDAILALNMDSDDVLGGTTAIYNSAANDGSLPTTQTTSEIGYVDSQNVTKYKRTKLEGYSNYYDLLNNDATKDFISKFKPLFAKYIFPSLYTYEFIDNE
jgi:hypothetical protein